MSSEPLDPRRELADTLGHEVRASQRATDVVDDLVCQLLGINRTDGRCLDILEHRGQMTAGRLASESGLTSGAITAVIDRLERAGLARRVPDATDRRRVLVEVTEKARAASWELFRPMAEAVEPMITLYDEGELQLLIDFQRRGRELQECHAEWLREKLRERKGAS